MRRIPTFKKNDDGIDYRSEIHEEEEIDFANPFNCFPLATYDAGKLQLNAQVSGYLSQLTGEMSIVALVDEKREEGAPSILNLLPHYEKLKLQSISSPGVWALGKPLYEDSRQIEVLFLYVEKTFDPEKDSKLVAIASLLSSLFYVNAVHSIPKSEIDILTRAAADIAHFASYTEWHGVRKGDIFAGLGPELNLIV